MKYLAIALSSLALVGAGCVSPAPPPSTPPPQAQAPTEQIAVSIDGSWRLQTYTAPGKSAQDVSKLNATLVVEPGARLSAKICNGMSGEYDIQAGTLKVAALMSTKMFCEGLTGEVEAAFAQGLSSGMAMEQNGNMLVLRSTTGAAFSYTRAKTDTGRMGAPSDETPGEDRTYAGVVTTVDLHQMMVDGPAVIILKTASGAEARIHVPSMGLGLCKAKASIADVSELKVGQTVEARGEVGEDGVIVPCQSETHYLRIVQK